MAKPMLLIAAAALAVAPPPPRRVAPLRSLSARRPGILALTVTSCSPAPPPPVAAEAPAPPQEAKPKPRRYPKQYPGEPVGVAEEMRFVAMRLRNPKRTTIKDKAGTEDADAGASEGEDEEEEDDGGGGVKEEHENEEEGELEEGEWMPSMEGFVRYLVDSKLVFGTIERVVAESTDVAYVYFRKSGLERAASISKDLEWFRKQGIAIPKPSTSGSTYAAYLTELAESNAPAFLSHYYNIYFAHITGGVAIGNKICKKILEGRELEFYKWDTDAEFLLKDAREKLNELSKHWTRKDRNLCLKETAKCFQYMGKMRTEKLEKHYYRWRLSAVTFEEVTSLKLNSMSEVWRIFFGAIDEAGLPAHYMMDAEMAGHNGFFFRVLIRAARLMNEPLFAAPLVCAKLKTIFLLL